MRKSVFRFSGRNPALFHIFRNLDFFCQDYSGRVSNNGVKATGFIKAAIFKGLWGLDQKVCNSRCLEMGLLFYLWGWWVFKPNKKISPPARKFEQAGTNP
ncbi:hypothetical protein X474_11720 [Dethiosulfatarculus sandiegensis]|uniref:Uncharacterized protein n=1 Tax=Dethiosulfatarculus sandiegensis TaxID=1429043 RepID=A0A0D2JWB3_9BACT|nr:hypothetical protein X474_11720 [Dethiosulfatarculus sandiegensis]